MKWLDLLQELPCIASGGTENPVLSSITCDSREVRPGSLFVAISGFSANGDKFIPDALANGAAAVVSQNNPGNISVPWAKVGNARQVLGVAAQKIYGIDLSGITMVGITGTNGKTTTAYLTQMLLSQVYSPVSVWMFGTIKYLAGNKTESAHTTTPEASLIFKDIYEAAQKPSAIVMEASSHSLALFRIAGLSYDCTVFTNLTQDHLDFHESMENYYQAKKLLFTDYRKPRGKAVINIDDAYGKRLVEELGRDTVVTFGVNEKADVRIVKSLCEWNQTTIELSIRGKPAQRFTCALAGGFNVYNMTTLCAIAVALDIDSETVKACFASISTVPGRMDRVALDAPFSVFVDYAHTPDALENVLSTAAKLTQGRLFCVFGCGGDRDRKKRPIMAEAVARHSDEAFVTSDNPRSEKPEDIISDVAKGMPLDFPFQIIVDRKAAIRAALRAAKAKDCIVVAGKGHEDYQEIKGVRHHFDDKEIIVEAYKELTQHE